MHCIFIVLSNLQESLLVASSMSLKRYLDERQSKPKILENKQREISEDEITQYTDLEFSFELKGNGGNDFLIQHFFFFFQNPPKTKKINPFKFDLQRFQSKYLKIVNNYYHPKHPVFHHPIPLRKHRQPKSLLLQRVQYQHKALYRS